MYRQITLTLSIEANSQTVFQAISSASALESWFCDVAVVNPFEGGSIEVHWGKHPPRTKGLGKFITFIANQEITIRWDDAPKEKYLSFRIIKNDENSCNLEVIDFAPEKDIDIVKQSWEQMLLAIKQFCES